jgi:helix-turn-helix protein
MKLTHAHFQTKFEHETRKAMYIIFEHDSVILPTTDSS